MQENTLSSDLFMEQAQVDSLVNRILSRQDQRILAKTDFLFIESSELSGAIIEVDVVDYDYSTRLFTCFNEQLGIQTTRFRQNLLLDTDPPNFVKESKRRTVFYKTETCQYLRVARLIQQEMIKRY